MSDNNYCKISFKTMEALINKNLSGQELRTVLYIMKRTASMDELIPLNEFAIKLDTTKPRMSNILTNLIQQKVITVTENDNGKVKRYLFNRNVDTWEEPLPKNVTPKATKVDNTGKNKYLEFVFLKEEEYQKLLERFSEEGCKQRIEDLNTYIGQKGEQNFNKKYASHYHCILKWYPPKGWE